VSEAHAPAPPSGASPGLGRIAALAAVRAVALGGIAGATALGAAVVAGDGSLGRSFDRLRQAHNERARSSDRRRGFTGCA